jgi:replicative DNA helicase
VDDFSPPTDAELSLIGACFWYPERLDETTLNGSDFENPALGILFDRMGERRRAGIGVSQALLCEDFPDHVRDIWRSTDFVSEINAADSLEELILGRALRRRIREATVRIAQITSGNNDRLDLIDSVRAEIDAATELKSLGSVTSMKDDIRAVLAEHRSSVTLTPSPWAALNDVIVGFGPGRMYVIGARPGVGKSALALQIAYELAASGPVVFASLEMDKGELYSRIVSQQAQIWYSGMSGTLPTHLAARESEWIDRSARDIRVLDAGSQSVQSIRAAARSAAREGRLGGVVVDYIHLLTSKDGENETTRIAAITRQLKQLAMDLKVPVIALSQLNRAVSSRPDGRPNLADLRGSGAIEQDGDVVLFLYRDTNEEDTNRDSTILHGFVAKNRQGESFVDFQLEWQGEFVRAVDERRNY